MDKVLLELIGEEFSIFNLSNKLTALNFEDICDFDNQSELLEDGNVIICETRWEDIDNCRIQIFFEVEILAGNEEKIESSCIKIIDIVNLD